MSDETDAQGVAALMASCTCEGGFIDFVATISMRHLLLVGWLHGPRDASVSFFVAVNEELSPLESETSSFFRSDVPPSASGRIAILDLGADRLLERPGARLMARVGDSVFWLDSFRAHGVAPDACGRIAEMFAMTPAERRQFAACLGRFGEQPPDPVGMDPHFRRHLDHAEAACLSDLPTAFKDAHQNRMGAIDWIVPIDDSHVFVAGWLSGVWPGERVDLVTVFGGRTEISQSWHRFHRADVEVNEPRVHVLGRSGEHTGFACLATVRPSTFSHRGLFVEIGAEGGERVELRTPPAITDPCEGRDLVLQTEDPLVDERFLTDHVHPAMSALTRRFQQLVGVRRVAEFGQTPLAPDVSIVIPLYRRLDLLTPQIALLADDPDLRRSELVLVLDSPELEADLARLCGWLWQLYGVPMRVVFLKRSAGYANANNLGVEAARGRFILLLNSDVFPKASGWLRRLVDFHERTPDIGALGPKLLFEDDSLQHAGLYFERDPVSRLWQNRHYFKGLPGGYPPANVTRPVPAVTGACLLIARDTYRRLGGLDPFYVRGDYEDSDLCLRLRADGLDNWYLPEVELYHLERQSYGEVFATMIGRNATAYNRWRHTKIWDKEIEHLECEFSPEPRP